MNLRRALRLLLNSWSEDYDVRDGYIYIDGKMLNLTRMGRPWPFTAEYEDYYKVWHPCDTVFPGSYMDAPHLPLRIQSFEPALAFVEYSFIERLRYALEVMR